MIYGLDLFSGIGGFAIALDGIVSPIAYCESDAYCQTILLSRMFEGVLQRAPIWDDITTLSKDSLPEDIDIITAGFPCQDISVAGTKQGLAGKRSGLYFELKRLISEIRPKWIFLENVPAISLYGLEQITLDLTSMGYDSRWTVVSAQEVGACHIRQRWFMLANSNGQRLRQKCGSKIANESESQGTMELDDSCFLRGIAKSSARIIEPRVDRNGDGLHNKMDRNKALGNSIVPQAAREAFIRLLGIEREEQKRGES